MDLDDCLLTLADLRYQYDELRHQYVKLDNLHQIDLQKAENNYKIFDYYKIDKYSKLLWINSKYDK